MGPKFIYLFSNVVISVTHSVYACRSTTWDFVNISLSVHLNIVEGAISVAGTKPHGAMPPRVLD